MAVVTHADYVEFSDPENSKLWYLLPTINLLEYTCAANWVLLEWLTDLERTVSIHMWSDLADEANHRNGLMLGEPITYDFALGVFEEHFHEHFGYNFSDINRTEAEAEAEQEAGEEAAKNTFFLGIKAVYTDGTVIPPANLELKAGANIFTSTGVDTFTGAKLYEFKDTRDTFEIGRMTVWTTIGGLDYRWEIDDFTVLAPDTYLELSFDQATATFTSHVKVNQWKQERFELALKDWGLFEDMDQYLEWVASKVPNLANIGRFIHRCLDDVSIGKTESDMVLDEDTFGFSDRYHNWVFYSRQTEVGGAVVDEISFDNKYDKSFLLVERYVIKPGMETIDEYFDRDTEAIAGWDEMDMEYVTSYIASPKETLTLQGTTGISDGRTPSVFRFYVISAYTLDTELPTWTRGRILNAGEKGVNTLQYFKDNVYKETDWKAGKGEIWNPMDERERLLYDFNGNMGLTTDGATEYKELLPNSELPPEYRSDVDSDFGYWGIIFGFLALAVIVYFVAKKFVFKKGEKGGEE